MFRVAWSGKNSINFSKTRRMCTSHLGLHGKWNQTCRSGNGFIKILPQHSRGHPILKPSLWFYCEPLCSCYHKWWYWAPIRRHPRLLRVLCICPCFRCCQERLSVKVTKGNRSWWVDRDVEKIAANRSPFRVPVSIKRGRCSSNDLASSCSQTISSSIET